MAHPHIYWRMDGLGGLRTVDAVRRSIKEPGLARRMWQSMLELCESEQEASPLTCHSMFPGRPASAAESNNPDYTVCRAAGQRILRHAVALHVTEREDYKRAALRQMEALFDEAVWPDWIDQAHLRFGHPADLRTGMLSQDVGLAYDWLYPFLTTKEREWIIEGLSRRGIEPYLTSMEQDPWWSHDMNNWYTVIIGGLGVAGMALGSDHPEAGRLVEISLPKMQRYLSIYGEDGSFNESVAYSGATRIPVAYFNALYYHLGGTDNPLARTPFPETAEWTIHATLPPGRFAAFGDSHAEAPVDVAYITAIAAATRNPVVQGYAVRHMEAGTNPYELLWLDPSLEGISPEGQLPLGIAYHGNSALIFSRSSWNAERPEMIIYGKAKRAHNHGHNDLGQLCIDVQGRRMITDPGSPSSYPEDFFDDARYRYYNASTSGHNVLMFGGREQRHPPQDRGVKGLIDFENYNGRILQANFDEKGGVWQLDLSHAYEGVVQVRRTVIHLLPGWVAVLDEAELSKEEAISLRWHTIAPPRYDDSGHFLVEDGKARVAGFVQPLKGAVQAFSMRRHAYAAPYDRDRTGEALEQRKEPYLEWILKDRHCRILTLFASSPIADLGAWTEQSGKWSCRTASGTATASIDEERSSLILDGTLKDGTRHRLSVSL
ncbi:MAG: heparinase II/III family protein [Puniceicoccaceae bacterium]